MRTIFPRFHVAFIHRLCALLTLSVTLAAMPTHAQVIMASGHAPVNDLLLAWNQSQTGVSVRFEALLPADGVDQAINRKVDFGVADYVLDAKTLRDNRLLQLPLTISAVGLAVNLKEAAGGVKLDGATLAGIFSGRIMFWNDPAIVAMNPSLANVQKSIAPVIRTDPAGITRTFTEFLTVTDANWRANNGVVYQFRSRTAIGKQGAAGVIDAVKTFDGAIGYVDFVQGAKAGLTFAQVRNYNNEFVGPTRTSLAQTLQSLPWNKAINGSTYSFEMQITNMVGNGVYPLMYGIYAFVPRGVDKKRETAVRSYLLAGMKDRAKSEQLGYIALPPVAVSTIESEILR
jgi:phosphate transport system substrate-binding protein